jgi:hypothetical protein
MVPDLSPRTRAVVLGTIVVVVFVGLPLSLMIGSDASLGTKFSILGITIAISALVIGAMLAQMRGEMK